MVQSSNAGVSRNNLPFYIRLVLAFIDLGCKRFRGQHNAENITEHYEEIISFYKLQGEITNIITDNASNMFKAFRLPGFDLIAIDGSSSDSCDEDDDDDDSIHPINLKNCMTYIPEHEPCFIHSLQKVVKAGFKETGTVNKVLAKAAKIVSYVRRSIRANDILEGEKRLQAKVVTR